MDLKVLFHNPEELSEEELSQIIQRLNLQRSLPWTAAFFGGFGAYFLDAAVLRRSHDVKRVAAGAVVGFLLGAYSAYNVSGSSLARPLDQDIINAFDRKYMTNALNATGFGSNYVSIRDYSNTNSFKKPY